MKLIVTAFFTILTLQIYPNLDSAIVNRLDAFNAVAGNPIQYRVLGQTADDDGAVIYLEARSKATSEVYPGIVDWGVALRQPDTWIIYLPGDPDYGTAYDRLSNDVLSRASSLPYQIHADPTLAGALDGYQFPWEEGEWATVTRSYDQHGTGRIDFDLSRRRVTAAKDGVIVYANDSHSANTYASAAWWYWNTVIIQHGAHEYSLYGHVAPGSIPGWIKNACSADLSAPNCAVPVKAGQMIALEGSTGYSSNPHLHLEFGQDFGVVAYMDSADEDHDGVRDEPVYTGYIYAEQNVGISGYTPADVGGWAFGTLQQATHDASLPTGVNLLVNGDFGAGTDGWTPSGQINWMVQNGALRITRLRTAAPPDWASFYQNVDHGVYAHTPFEATLQLGNTSGIAKTVTVSVYNRSGRQYGLIGCAFQVPADTPLQQYTIRGVAVNTWASLRFEVSVNPADGSPAVLVDDLSLQVRPDVSENECITPT